MGKSKGIAEDKHFLCHYWPLQETGNFIISNGMHALWKADSGYRKLNFIPTPTQAIHCSEHVYFPKKKKANFSKSCSQLFKSQEYPTFACWHVNDLLSFQYVNLEVMIMFCILFFKLHEANEISLEGGYTSWGQTLAQSFL